jgi:purine-nucleoside phosphorylase
MCASVVEAASGHSPGRLPAYFQLQRYNITPADIVRGTFRCEPEAIRPRVILMPWWRPEIFAGQVANLTTITEGAVYQLEYRGQPVTVIRSGIGAPQAGDAVLALACTPCETIVFTGSVGGLDPTMAVGDLLLPTRSFCGDGFSRYLGPELDAADCFLHPAEPDPELAGIVKEVTLRVCQDGSVRLYQGTVYATDSIIAQFHHLDHLVERLGCIGIEMETAAVFRAARLVGIRAGALLQMSDVIPVCKSLYSGRTADDMARRRLIRRTLLAEAVLEAVMA